MDLSDAPTSIRESWHALLNRLAQCNAVLLDRDVTWQEIWGVFLSVLSLRWVQICTADSPRDARLLSLLEPFCLIPQSPQRPLRSSLCCPTAAAFYRPSHESTSLEDGLWGADPYWTIRTQAAMQDCAEPTHTYLCTYIKVNIYQGLM